MPHDVAEEMRETFIGQLRLQLGELITGQKNVIPNFRQILRYLRKTSLANAQVGDIYHTIFLGRPVLTGYAKLPLIGDVSKLLEKLEDEGWNDYRFLEVYDCPSPLPATLGVTVSDAALGLPGGGRIYVVTFLGSRPLEGADARLEVRASRANPGHTFSIFTREGWKVFNASTASGEPWIKLALQCLEVLHTAESAPNLVYIPVGTNQQASPAESIESEISLEIPETPDDPEYHRLLLLVVEGKIPCVVMRVPLAAIRPYSAEFALDVPSDAVDGIAAELRRGTSARMLLYRKENTFIVSDDYSIYLAERLLRREVVEAVVMGEVSAELTGSILIRGGPELIPGAAYLKGESRSTGHVEWLNEYRRANKSASYELIKLHLLYIQLTRLLQAPWTRERHLHRFLESNPVVLDAYGAEVRSEVSLGKSYRMDLVLQYAESGRRILLVELEPATQELFTRSGRWDAKITHAIQQVQDWMRWWREHPDDVPAPFDPSIPIKGLIVVGRDENLDESAKRRLIHNNHQFRDLTVLTYDDLLRRLDRLMSSLGFQ